MDFCLVLFFCQLGSFLLAILIIICVCVCCVYVLEALETSGLWMNCDTLTGWCEVGIRCCRLKCWNWPETNCLQSWSQCRKGLVFFCINHPEDLQRPQGQLVTGISFFLYPLWLSWCVAENGITTQKEEREMYISWRMFGLKLSVWLYQKEINCIWNNLRSPAAFITVRRGENTNIQMDLSSRGAFAAQS